VKVNCQPARAYVDFGSQVTTVQQGDAECLKLTCNSSDKQLLQNYGGGCVPTVGTTSFKLQVDDVVADVGAVVKEDKVQSEPLIVGQTFTEQPGVQVVKDEPTLHFFRCMGGEEGIVGETNL